MNTPLRRVLVMLPTYNESRNIEAILTAVLKAYEGIEVLVIDDSSPDGTGDLVRGFSEANPRVHLLVRTTNRGLANAYKDAFRWALARPYDLALMMDADFSHDPSDIPRLIAQAEHTDIAIGSRYTPGGGVAGWPFHRRLLSAAGNLYARTLLGIGVKDLTGGFIAWRKAALACVPLERINVRGYSFIILLKFLAFRKGCSLGEVPIIFRDRTQGKSKMSGHIALEAILKIPVMKATQLWNERRSFFAMLAVLLASIPLVELLVPTPQDIKTMFSWMGLAFESGVSLIYAGNAAEVSARLGDFSPNYPPLIFWVYYPAYALLRFLGWAGEWPSTLANLLFRLPLFFVQALAAVAVGRFAMKRTEDPKLAWLTIGANPALILAGPLWGQFEIFQWTACFFGMGTLLRGQPWLSGLWFALAFLIKPQFVFFVPLIAALAWKHMRIRRWQVAASFAAVVTILTAPFMLADGMSWFTEGYGRLLDKQDAMTVTGFNLWWLTSHFLGWANGEELFLSLPLRHWALGIAAVFSAVLGLRYVFAKRSPGFVPFAAAYFTGLYTFLPGMSARFLAFGLLWTLVWAVEDKKARIAAGALSAFLVTALLYNPFFVAKSRFYGLLPESVTVAFAVIASAGAVLVTAWMALRCWRGAASQSLESLTEHKSAVFQLSDVPTGQMAS